MAWHAWSEIHYGEGKSLAAGSAVTQKQLGVDDENWEQLVEAGSVREYAYPDMPEGYNGSPIDFMRAQLAHISGAVEGSGTGYGGPPLEEALMNPELAGVLAEEAEAEEEEDK